MSYHLKLIGSQVNLLSQSYMSNGKICIFYNDKKINDDIINLFYDTSIGLEVVESIDCASIIDNYSFVEFKWQTYTKLYAEFADEETALYWSLKYLNA